MVLQQYGIYTSSCGVGTTKVGYLYSCVLECSARGMLLSLRPRRLCGERVDDTLPSLVARLLLLFCRPESMLSCTCGVGIAVVGGQRDDALPSLVALSHALFVYLWCWSSSTYGTYTRSCSVALKAYALVHLLNALPSLVARSNALVYLLVVFDSSRVYILAPARMLLLCTCGVGITVWYLYSLLLCRPEGMLLCTCGVYWHSSMMVSILVQSSYG